MTSWVRGWLAVAMCLTAGAARAADLADSIPASAKAVLIINNAKDLEKNLRSFAQSIGTPLPEGMGVDMAAQMSGMAGLWQMERGTAVALMSADREGLAVVLPVKDAKAALKQLNAAADGELYKLNVLGSPALALPKDGVLIVAPNAKALESFKGAGKSLGSRMHPVDKKVASGTDLFVYVNVPELKDLATGGLDYFDQNLKQPIAQMAAAGGQDPQTLAKMFDLYVKGLRRLVSDGRSLCLGLSFNADRVQIQKGLTFQSGTAMAKYFQKENTTKASELIDDLPNRSFFAAVGWDADLGGELYHDAAFSLVDAATKLDKAERDRIEKFMTKMFESMESTNMLMDFTDNGMVMFGHYETKKPAEFIKLLRDNKDATAAMSKEAFGQAGKVDVSVSIKKVGKLDVTEFEYKFSDLPAQQQKAIERMYGGNTMRMQMAAVDKESVGFVSGGKGDPINLLIDPKPLIKEQRVKTALGDLPEKAGLVVLLDPAALAKFAKSMAEQAGQQVPIPAYDKPIVPIGIAGMGEKDGVVFRIVVRADTVRELLKPVLGR